MEGLETSPPALQGRHSSTQTASSHGFGHTLHTAALNPPLEASFGISQLHLLLHAAIKVWYLYEQSSQWAPGLTLEVPIPSHTAGSDVK